MSELRPWSSLPRRDLLRSAPAATVAAWASVGSSRAAAAAENVVHLGLKETAGLRRFGYPVHTTVPGAKGGTGVRYRLEREGKAVPAQFRDVTDEAGNPVVALDFNASPGPLAAERYTVRYGADVPPGPEPRGGLRLTRGDGAFRVASGSSLVYEVPERLVGWLSAVRNARLEFVRGKEPQGLRLELKGRPGERPVFSDPASVRGSVVREGPLAVGLRFEGAHDAPDGPAVRSRVDLTFPSSKSWVEVVWSVDDPGGRVTRMSLELPLRLEGEPTLVDFGANNTVYATLKGGEAMTLESGPRGAEPADQGGAYWAVWKGPPLRGGSEFARSVGAKSVPAEGWAHVTDRSRCTALAVAGFGRERTDSIAVEASGRVRLSRWFDPTASRPAGFAPTLRCWFHFVTNPVQVGALTSPQAMLAPLAVEWEG